MSRPRIPVGSDEDELLEMQKKFFSGRETSSDVKIKNSVNPQVGDLVEDEGTQPEKIKDYMVRDKIDLDSLPAEKQIIGGIRERSEAEQRSSRSFPTTSETKLAFPAAFVRDKEIKSTGGKKRQSLFALQMRKKRGVVEEPMEASEPEVSTELPSTFLSHTPMLTSGEVKTISDENAAKLAAMTQEEILEEQQKIMSQMDPKLIEFLKKGRKAAPHSSGKKRSQSSGEGPGKKSVKFSNLDDIREISGDSLPVNPKDAKRWMHMDKVEVEKLKWMTELPAPKPVDPKTGYNARFNFKGELVAPGADIPVTHALHHHGEEPERAGYSLDELFTLSRSTVRQQKILALDTLAAILRKDREGYFDGILNQIMVKELLDSGILVIIRVALDEQVDSVISSALNALSALLWSKPDELCLDRVTSWPRGLEQPSLLTSVDTEEDTKKHFAEEKEELKDNEILQIDVIRACFRMDLLARMRYVLTHFQLPAPAVICTMEALTRIARHSLESAKAILDCDGLMDIIVAEFLPPHRLQPGVKPKALEKVNGVPLRQALKLVRVLAARDEDLAGMMVTKYPLVESILAYITVEPSESLLPIQEALRLSIEAFHTWRALLSYGLTTDDCNTLFPVIVKHLIFYRDQVSLAVRTLENKFNYDLGAALISFVETLFVVAGTHERLTIIQRTQSAAVPVPRISWDQIGLIGELVMTISQKWLYEVENRFSDVSDAGIQATAAALSAVATYFKCLVKQSSCTVQQAVDITGRLFNDSIQGFLKSVTFASLLHRMSTYSVIGCTLEPGTKRDPPNLPSIGSVTWEAAVTPVVKEGTPVALLSSVFRLVVELSQINIEWGSDVSFLWDNEALVKYIKRISKFSGGLSNHWFSKFEAELIYWLLKIVSFSKPTETTAVHTLSLVYTVSAPVGDECRLQEIFRQILFNRDFFREDELLVGFSSLGLGDTEHGKSLAKISLESLPTIRSVYEAVFFSEDILASSKANVQKVPHGHDTLSLSHAGAASLPADWPFAPLLAMLNRHQSRSSSEMTSDLSSPEEIEVLKHVMMFIYLLQLSRKSFISQLSPVARFTRVSCLFLAGSDLFLDATVSAALRAVLKLILDESPLLNFSKRIPGLAHFKDLYMSLMEQFEGVSYGNPVFGAYMLTPLLQPKHTSEIKRLVWGEHPITLRSLTTSEEMYPISLDYYTREPEADPVMVQMYAAAIFSGTVTKTRNPALYEFALRNVIEFARLNAGSVEHAKLVKSIQERICSL